MKKILCTFLSLTMLLTMFATTPLTAQAETYEKTIDGITYKIDTETGEAKVDDADTSITTANIKPEVDGYSVTSIGDEVFYDCTSLKTITIPDSVTSIGEYAFDKCNALTSINVNENNQNYCSENGVLFNKDKTELIQYPAGRTDTSYTIPDSVTSVGVFVFGDCTSLTTVTIPNSITTIGDLAFYNCTSLTTVTIPNSIITIGNLAFNNCTDLTSINVNENNQNYCSENGVLFNKDKTELIQYPAGKTDTSYTIPGSVVNIGDSAFKNCTSLAELTLGGGVTSIDHYAFYKCTALTSVTIPDNVTNIAYSTFEGCASLTKIMIGASVTKIDNNAFRDCTSLAEVSIGVSVTSIDQDVFFGCTSLTSINVNENNQNYFSENGVLFNKDKTELIQYPVGKTDISYTIPGSVVNIGDSAFENCTLLTEVTIPDNVTSIGSGAFWSCTSLVEVTIGDGVTSIYQGTFRDCTSLTSINVSESNQNYCSENGVLFSKDKTKLIQYPAGKTDKAYTTPDGVTSIGYNAFRNCTSLAELTLGGGVTSIDNYAFYKCTALTSVTIPDSVTSVKDRAFYNCTSLTSVTIPDSLSSIGKYAFGYYYDNNDDKFKKIENFTIYGNTGSAAEIYANSNKIAFVSLGQIQPTTTSTTQFDNKIDAVFTDWSENEPTFIKTVGWHSNAANLDDIKGAVTIDENGYNIDTTGFEFNSQIIQAEFPIDAAKAASAIETAIADNDGKLKFRITVSSAKAGKYETDETTGEKVPNFYDTNMKFIVYCFANGDWQNSVNLCKEHTIENSPGYADITFDVSKLNGMVPDTVVICAMNSYYDQGLTYAKFTVSPIVVGELPLAEKPTITTTTATVEASTTTTQATTTITTEKVPTTTVPTIIQPTSTEEIPTTTQPITTTATDLTTTITETTTTKIATTTKPITTKPTTTKTTTTKTTTEPTTVQSTTLTTITTTTVSIKGDVNGDGKISVADARKLVVAIAKGDTQASLEFGDVNSDGKISVADARKIVVAIAKNDYNF